MEESEKNLQFIKKNKKISPIFEARSKSCERKWNKKNKQNENEIRNYLVLFIIYVN